MPYIEKQKKGNKTYYYLTQTLRQGNRFKKVRVLLAENNQTKEKLNKLAQTKQKQLEKKIQDIKNTTLQFSDKIDPKNIKQKYVVWERPCKIHLVFIAAEALFLPLKKHFGRCYGDTYFFFRDEMVKAIWSLQHIAKSGIIIINNMLNNEYFDHKIKHWNRLTEKLEKFFKKIDKTNLKSLSNNNLSKLYTDYNKVFLDWWGFGQVAECVSYGGEYLIRTFISEKDFPLITSPIDKSYTTVEEEELMKIVQKINNNSKLAKIFKKDNKTIRERLKYFKEVQLMIENHTKKYFWIQNNFFETKILTQDFFIDQIKEALNVNLDPQRIIELNNQRLQKTKKQKAELIKKLRLDEKHKKLIKILDYFIDFQDFRKAMVLQGNHYIDLFIAETHRRTGIAKELLDFSTPYEIEDILTGKFNIDVLKSRKKHSLLIITEKELKIITSPESVKEENRLLGKASREDITEFEGNRAQGGKVTGKVVKILDPRKPGEFKPGDILVTTMTSPDFMPLMKKASAIITDEGGITCHAAIVARELSKPCVIGTKIATDVLNTGDTVEVIANHGVIKIVRRKSE